MSTLTAYFTRRRLRELPRALGSQPDAPEDCFFAGEGVVHESYGETPATRVRGRFGWRHRVMPDE